MFDANVPKVLERIGPGDLVLDVGGWARCFNRADHVIDLFPYETRGRHYRETFGLGPQGGPAEHFTTETWACRDLCSHEPWPYVDQQFDFCTCSHTLEDLRDPLWVCHEMVRVAKRGYVEIPSMAFELSRGREPGVPVGLSHHKWFVELKGSKLEFIPKLHFVHGDRGLSLPASFGGSLPADQLVTWLFWEGDFAYGEGWFTREQLAERVRAFGAEPEPADDPAFAIDRARLALAQAQRELGESRAREAQLRVELEGYAGLGPRALTVARRLNTMVHRHPRIASWLRRYLPAA